MREHQRWLGCRSETGDATQQWAHWLRGRFSTLTYFPFVSVAACWKMGCILLQTPHPATKIQRREAEVITENSMGTLLWQLYDNLYDCQKIFHHLLGDFFPLVNSSSQYAICCERYDALRIIEHSAWKKNKKQKTKIHVKSFLLNNSKRQQLTCVLNKNDSVLILAKWSAGLTFRQTLRLNCLTILPNKERQW